MSYFPNEAEPLWSKYSTHAVAHTVDLNDVVAHMEDLVRRLIGPEKIGRAHV